MNPVIDLIVNSEWFVEERYGRLGLAKFFSGQMAKNKPEHVSMVSHYITPDGGVSYSRNIQADSIAYHKMHGIMIAEDGDCTIGMSTWATWFSSVDNNANVKGHIIEVHSGGGQATAGVMMMNAIKEAKKPVIIYAHYMASAAYLGSIYAKEIILSSDMSMIGSIGAMMTINMKELAKFRKNYKAFYSKKSEKKNGVMKALEEGDEQPIVNMLTKLDEAFMDVVRKERNMSLSTKLGKKALSGEMFQGREGVRVGLADGIGDLDYVKRRLKKYK